MKGDVVGWGAVEVLSAAFDDKEVAVLDAGVETDAVGGQMLVEVAYEHVALLGL